MSYAGGKGKSSWEDQDYDDEEYEEYEEDDDYEDPDVAAKLAATKAREAKLAADAQKQKIAEAKKSASKPKAEPAAKAVVEPEPEKPLTSDQKKQIEEDNRKMNYELSAELFGGVDVKAISRPTIKLPRDETFETYQPKTDAEFNLLAEYVGGHIAIHSNEFQYKNMLKTLLKAATAHLQPAEIDDISTSLAIARDEREKANQAARVAQPVKTRADDYASDFM